MIKDRFVRMNLQQLESVPTGQCLLATNSWDEERDVICWQLFYLLGVEKSADPAVDKKYAFGHWIMPRGWENGVLSLEGLALKEPVFIFLSKTKNWDKDHCFRFL